jgi:hypothetical protein
MNASDIDPLQPLPPLSLDFVCEPLTREASLTDLRDYFAATALQGAIASPTRFVDGNGAPIGTPESYASLAYDIADAMLAAREQPRFPDVSCSSCGQSFGPGDEGFSHCADHAHLQATEA